jgi:Tol biopolymer transport system component
MHFHRLLIAALLLTSCGDGGNGGLIEPTTGALEITTTTAANAPADAYTVTVDGGPANPIGANGSMTIEDLEVGSHTIQLTVPEGCTVEGDNPRTVSVLAGSTVTAAFNISCEPAAPASAMIAFSGFSGTSSGIFVVNPDGTGLKNLSADTPFDSDPVWSPDGRSLLFRGTFGLYTMNADGSNRRELRGDIAPVEWSWSPDGSRIAFVVQRFEPDWLVEELWLMGADGESMAMLASDAAMPSWSPDGQRIAFGRFPRDGELDIRVINVDGTGETALTDPELAAQEPAWSPDGDRIAFTSLSHPGIYTINLDGTDLQRLSPERARDEGAVWSPDGSMLAFTSRPSDVSVIGGEIGVMNRDGSNRRILTSDPGIDQDPDWSPDGRKIVFMNRIRGQQSDIYVMNADGSGLLNVSNMPSTYDVEPDWSP